MPLACLYHKTLPMRVVNIEDRDALVALGEWFSHPNCEKIIEVTHHEEPIRQQPRKRRSNGEHSPKKNGI